LEPWPLPAETSIGADANGQYILANPQRLASPILWGLPVVSTETRCRVTSLPMRPARLLRWIRLLAGGERCQIFPAHIYERLFYQPVGK
jgi:hypothetical protein